MWLVVGLGNPGNKYRFTRHNIGFLAVDGLAQGWTSPAGATSESTEHKALTQRLKVESQPILLAKPQTFMNLSGESVLSLLQFYKIPKEQLVVLQDDIEIPFASMRFHKNRGHGGHNGIKSISQVLGGNDYIRLKLGVGRPPHPEMDVADYVLQNFSSEEMKAMPDFLNRACEAVETLIFEGLDKASSRFNS